MQITKLKMADGGTAFVPSEQLAIYTAAFALAGVTDYTTTEVMWLDGGDGRHEGRCTVEFCELCQAMETADPPRAFWAFCDWLATGTGYTREKVESWLHEVFGEKSTAVPEPEYTYGRVCRCCNVEFGVTKITREVYENALNNDAIKSPRIGAVRILSVCEDCRNN